jgi:hypothetical protein
MVVTAPYTHYYPSFTITMSVLCGVSIGELWRRMGARAGAAACVAAAVCLIWMIAAYYREAALNYRVKRVVAGVIDYIPLDGPAGKTWYVPPLYTPAIHYHRPKAETVAYDSYSPESLAAELAKQGGAAELLCAAPVCEAVRKQLSGPVAMKQIAEQAGGIEGVFALTASGGQ